MFTNLYHIASFRPVLRRENMTVGREELAQRLVKSGQLRIDAGERINFARLYIPDLRVSSMFSYRELHDKTLAPKTKKKITKELEGESQGPALEAKVQKHIKILKAELDKYQPVSSEEELQLARLIVQATHPVVIMLILIEGVEIFISHSHNIGDVLDIVSWQQSGNNSGMQSTNGKDAAIFISCGGNPLIDNESKTAEYGDGWPARARVLIIGGQELGHYSDIMRDENGHQASRYSANFSATKAKEHVRIGRIKDIKTSKQILDDLNEIGLADLVETEKKIKFYIDNKNKGIRYLVQAAKLKIQKIALLNRAKKKNITFLNLLTHESRFATLTKAMVEDMLFNLSPKADVYQNPNKDVEEAIACVEALARVPQQVNKWGKPLTQVLMKNLYQIYFTEVIPGCVKAYEVLSKKKYEYNKSKTKTSFISSVKNLFKKELFYPEEKSSLLK